MCISKHFIFTLTVLSKFAFHLLYSSLVTLKAKLFMELAGLFFPPVHHSETKHSLASTYLK